MLRRSRLAAALVLILLIVSGSSALAQGGGTQGDKFVLGQNYMLHSGETLNGSLAVLGGNAILEQGSTVNGDVAVAGGELTIAGTVRGSVAVFGGSTTLKETAVIQGDFASYGGSVVRAPGATIQGGIADGGRGPLVTIPRIQVPFLPIWPFQSNGGGGLSRIITWELGALGAGLLIALLGVLAVLLAPKAMGRIASTAAGQPAFTFGVGLLTIVVAILGGTLLLIACGVGLLVWLALVIGLLVGWIAVGLWLGQWLLATLKMHPASSLVEVAVGVFVITFLGRLPLCIGFLFSVIVGCIGLGAVVLTRFGTQPAGGRPVTPPPGDTGGDLQPPGLLPAGEVPAVRISEPIVIAPEVDEVPPLPVPEPPGPSAPEDASS